MPRRPLTLLLALLGAAALSHGADAIDPATVLETLKPGHPRLMLLDDRLDALRTMSESDETLQRYGQEVKAQADAYLDAAPLEHVLVGPRLLSVSRSCVARMYPLALAYRWLGDEKYAKAAEANLLTVCAFPDWNPSHFLDTAEMTHAVAIGYDWLYDYLSDESRETIRQAIIRLGLEPGKAVYENGGWWTESAFNWNQVCNAGMVIGALAIADTNPEWPRYILPKAVASFPLALDTYNPDGAWQEGPSYWHYATRYTAYGLCAMDTALGTTFGLADKPGLRVTGLFPTYLTGPTGLLLNYADSGERSQRRPMPCMFWLAEKYGNTVISDAEHAVLKDGGATAMHVMWYLPPTGETTAWDLDRYFKSSVDIVVMRSAWNDPNALFVGVKGGYNSVNHGHLDLGNFEMDALGVRWARDLGSDNYNLDGYFDKKKGGKRWNYYRMVSSSHNVCMLDGHDQLVEGNAKVLDFETAADSASVTLDLTSAYSGLADSVVRDVGLVADRRAVIVTDRFELSTAREVLWGMTTDAIIEVDGATAQLTDNGKNLVATILEPAGAAFTVESAEQPEPQKPNTDVKRLLVRIPEATGKTRVSVLLAPVWEDGAVTAAAIANE